MIEQITFYKLGGTWDMVERDGRLVGSGNLDDGKILELEKSVGLYGGKFTNRQEILKAEKKLSGLIYEIMLKTEPEPVSAQEHLKSWCWDFGEYAEGPFTAIYSGDSSHLRATLVAPMISILLRDVLANPERPVVFGQGTDTADAAILPLLDVLVYDTQLPPFYGVGANRSHREEDSDAPANFTNAARLAGINIPNLFNYSVKDSRYRSAATWIFDRKVYQAADLVKLDPLETRLVEGQSTFYAPNQTALTISKVLEYFNSFSGDALKEEEIAGGIEDVLRYAADPPSDHVVRAIAKNMDKLFEAMSGVYTVDLGSQNSLESEILNILNPRYKAVVIAAHSLGNVSNPIRWACVEATEKGKLVVDASRCLIGMVNQRYAGSLLDANENTEELGRSPFKVLSGYQLNKMSVRAIVTRALIEGRDQKSTEWLLNDYYLTRFPTAKTFLFA